MRSAAGQKQTGEADCKAAALTVFWLCQVDFRLQFGHRVFSLSKYLRTERPNRAFATNDLIALK
jgi:hypothetical protein